jgi:DUF2892 family protein
MNVDRAVFAFAGGMILLSLVLAFYVSSYWLLFTAFIGANMLQSAFTGFCPAAMITAPPGADDGVPADPVAADDRWAARVAGAADARSVALGGAADE